MVEGPASYPLSAAIVLFCDFDGTLTPADIGTALLRHYSSAAPLLEGQLLRREISVLEYYRRACAALSPECTPERIATFARRIGLRSDVHQLVDFCHREGIELAIISDGLDAYIMPLLEDAGLAHLPVACNRMRWQCGQPQVDFPWAFESCQQNCPSPYPCAACKRAVLLSWAPPGATLLYVGDGLSDFCPAFYADFVFARGELAAWCRQQGLAFFPYESLSDVCRQLKQLRQQRRLSPRYLPQQRRQRVWVEE